MIEQRIKFNHNDDPTIIILDEDKKKEVLKEAQDLCFAANEFYSRLKNNTLEQGFSETLLSLFESYTVTLHTAMNYDSVLKKEHDQRFSEIKELNSQNKELRKQLGDKVSSEDVREKLKNFTEKIQKWWKEEGFGYVSEIEFHPYVCKIKLSGSMCIHFEKTQPDFLRKKGYEIQEPERDSFELVHSEKNISLLIKEVTKRFPSAKLSKIELSAWHSLSIRDAEFIIHDFTDI